MAERVLMKKVGARSHERWPGARPDAQSEHTQDERPAKYRCNACGEGYQVRTWVMPEMAGAGVVSRILDRKEKLCRPHNESRCAA